MWRTNLRTIFSKFWLITLLLSQTSLGATLNGKIYVGQLGPVDPSQSFTIRPDEIQFRDGIFTSIASQALGFGPSSFQSKLLGKVQVFEAVFTNPRGDEMLWKGNINGRNVTANATLKLKSKDPVELRFQGKPKSR